MIWVYPMFVYHLFIVEAMGGQIKLIAKYNKLGWFECTSCVHLSFPKQISSVWRLWDQARPVSGLGQEMTAPEH